MTIDIDAIFQAVEAEAKTETPAKGERVQRVFRGKNVGGEDPQSVRLEAIFEAVRDYELSRRWN